MKNVFLKPAIDPATKVPVLVRDPVSRKPLAAEGEFKERDHFWLNRIRDKDVVEASPPIPAPGKVDQRKKD